MGRQRQVLTLVLVGGAVLALALLAGALPQLKFLPARPIPIGNLLQLLIPRAPEIASAPQSTLVLRVLITVVVWVLFPITVIALIVSSDLRRRLLKRLPVYIAVAFVVYWLLRLLRALLLSLTQQSPLTGQRGGASDPSASFFPTAPTFITDPPRWLVIVLSALVAALALLLFWSFRPRLRQKPQSLDLLVQEAQSALEQLQAGGDVRDTIMRCYADMSRVLRESRGVTRNEAMTPREFEQVLGGLGLRDEHIQQLTRLFERVRYSSAAPGEREEREAETCLSAIVAAYGKSA